MRISINTLWGCSLLSVVIIFSCAKVQELEEKDLLVSQSIETKDGLPPGGVGNLDSLLSPVVQIDSILGCRRNNPYSIRNMQLACDSLCRRGSLLPRILTPSHLYVRFLPQDTTEYLALKARGFELYDFPLDFEFFDEVNSYHDPSLPDSVITWQYCSLPIGEVLPNVHHEVLDTCYIPLWQPSIPGPVLMSFPGGGLSENEFQRQLEGLACEIANPDMMVLDSLTLVGDEINGINAKPHGYVKVSVNGVNMPVKKVKVRTWNFVKTAEAYTDENGYYQIQKHYYCNPRYSVQYENETGFAIYGWLVQIMPMFYVSKHHSKNGYNITFSDEDDKMWHGAVVNNRVYDYFRMCENEGRQAPPDNLTISIINDANYGGAAPMLYHMGNEMPNISGGSNNLESALIAFLGTIVSPFYGLVSAFAPDIIIKTGTYEELSERVYHELSHASHFMKAGRGYWAHYIEYIVEMYLNGEDTYGDGTAINNPNLSYCELGEAWGYANQKLFLKRNGYTPNVWGDDRWLHPSIQALFDLVDKGILTEKQIFSCMASTTNTVNLLRQRLCSTYSSKRIPITSCFAGNGALSSQTVWRVINGTEGVLDISMRKNGINWNSLTTESDTLVFLSSTSLSDSLNLRLSSPGFYPDTVLMVVSGMTIYQDKNGVITSSLKRPLFNPADWEEEIVYRAAGNKTIRNLYYALSQDDYE